MDVREATVATGAAVRDLLAELPEYDADDALRVGGLLRTRGLDPEIVNAALTQSRLRARARAKFGEFADGMIFTPEGLEQATRMAVAGTHARRFVSAGISRVADLTCGIGADSMAMSALGIAVMAFEMDQATALVADYNVRHWPGSVVVLADSMATVRDVDVDGVFADPARRAATGARHHRPADYQPALGDILALRDRFPALGVKVGPGIPHHVLPTDVETEWVSLDGDVVEAGLWCGPLAEHRGRGALVMRTGASPVRMRSSGAVAAVGRIEAYLYEPDGAVIRAGLVAEAAEALGGHLVDATIAYVTAPLRTDSPFATRYTVLDHFPFNVKALRAYLRERGVGRVTIKKRGTAVTPEALRAHLSLKGDAEATVVLTRVAGAQRILIVAPA